MSSVIPVISFLPPLLLSVHPPSAGRFVTRRRRAVAVKSKPPKATSNTLDSSDDFASGAFGSSRILRPSRRRRALPAFVVSSAENSVNAAGTVSFATNPLREISLNESADRSLGPCPRKPIFCSTPSAAPFGKRLKPLSINDQSSAMSVSCIGVMSTFPEDLDSSGQLVSPPLSAPPVGLHSEGNLQSSPGEKEPGDLFMKPKSTNMRISCSEEAKRHSDDITTKTVAELPSLNLLSTDDSESSSHFVSAAGGLEWLIEALKEKCLTERCTVQLERLDRLTVTQLCGQTTYSSCLGHSSSVHRWETNEHSRSVGNVQTTDPSLSSEPSFCLNLSVTNNKNSDYLQSENSFESPEHAASVTDSQSTNGSPSVECKPSAELSSSKERMEQSASVLYVESTHHTDSSVEFITGTQLPANGPVKTRFTVEDKCLTETCTVQLKNWALSPQLKGFVSENDHSHHTDDSEDLTCSGEIAERMVPFVRQSVNSSSAVAQTLSNDPETEEKAAVLTAVLKDKCLTDKLIVEIKRVTLSELKEILQLKGTKLKSPTDASDSASDDQTKSDHQSESDTNHCNEDTSGMKVGIKKGGSSSSEDKITSDKEKVVKDSCNVRHKRKKMSLAPKEKKRRSTSTDRHGTTRKACVSGLSVSRWKNKGSASTQMFRSRTAQTGGNKAVDCSISELTSMQHKQPTVRTTCTQTQHSTVLNVC